MAGKVMFLEVETLHPFDKGVLHFEEALRRPLTSAEWDYFVTVCGLPGTWVACGQCGRPYRGSDVRPDCTCGGNPVAWASLKTDVNGVVCPRC